MPPRCTHHHHGGARRRRPGGRHRDAPAPAMSTGHAETTLPGARPRLRIAVGVVGVGGGEAGQRVRVCVPVCACACACRRMTQLGRAGRGETPGSACGGNSRAVTPRRTHAVVVHARAMPPVALLWPKTSSPRECRYLRGRLFTTYFTTAGVAAPPAARTNVVLATPAVCTLAAPPHTCGCVWHVAAPTHGPEQRLHWWRVARGAWNASQHGQRPWRSVGAARSHTTTTAPCRAPCPCP